LQFFIWSWWGDIRVRTWNLVKNRKFHLLDEDRFLSSKWPILIDHSGLKTPIFHDFFH
jgi:hypothetical protein